MSRSNYFILPFKPYPYSYIMDYKTIYNNYNHDTNKKNFNNGSIYKITNTIDTMIYIGSTTININVRFDRHLQDSLFKTSKLYNHMRDIGKENFKMEMVELYPCKSVEELEGREAFWIRELDTWRTGLNTAIPQRTAKERYDDIPADIRKEKQRIQDEKKKLKRQNDPVEREKYNARMRASNARRKRLI